MMMRAADMMIPVLAGILAASARGQQRTPQAPLTPLEAVVADSNVLSTSLRVIEGGLAAPAAGVPVKPATSDDFYLDPLALEPGDRRIDLGRSEIQVEFQFSNPKSIPGQVHSNNYMIRPPENRTYDTLNINMNER